MTYVLDLLLRNGSDWLASRVPWPCATGASPSRLRPFVHVVCYLFIEFTNNKQHSKKVQTSCSLKCFCFHIKQKKNIAAAHSVLFHVRLNKLIQHRLQCCRCQAGHSSVGRTYDCKFAQQSNGPWFDSGCSHLHEDVCLYAWRGLNQGGLGEA